MWLLAGWLAARVLRRPVTAVASLFGSVLQRPLILIRANMLLPNLGSGSLVRLSLAIMNSATGSNSYGVGSGGYGAPAPRQDMEYLCAGDSIMCLPTLCSSLTFLHRLRCQKRNQVTRTHSMQGVWTSHNVQKEDQTECVYYSSCYN